MPSTAEVGKAIKQAKRAAKGKPKDKKPFKAPELKEVGGIHPPPGGWKGQTRTIPAVYLTVLRRGLQDVDGAAKNAERLNGSLRIAKGLGAQRAVEAAGVMRLIDEQDSEKDLVVPPHLVEVAQIAIALEHGHVKRAKANQLDLLIPDVKGLDKRLKELHTIAELLGMQAGLLVDDDKPEKKPAE